MFLLDSTPVVLFLTAMVYNISGSDVFIFVGWSNDNGSSMIHYGNHLWNVIFQMNCQVSKMKHIWLLNLHNVLGQWQLKWNVYIKA